MSDPLTREEALRLVEMAGRYGRSFSALRDRAAFAVMYGSGIRSKEASMLDLIDLRETPQGRSIRVRFPKGVNREKNPTPPREVGLSRTASSALDDWLEIRGGEPGPLFRTSTGRRVDPSQWRRKIKPIARAADVDRRVHCHGMRHTFARELHDEHASMKVIQQALGHASLETTAIYLSSIGSPEVVGITSERD